MDIEQVLAWADALPDSSVMVKELARAVRELQKARDVALLNKARVEAAVRILSNIAQGNGKACPEHGDTIHYCLHCVGEFKFHADKAEVFRNALIEVVGALGPEVPRHGCEGCEAEMSAALEVAKKALA